MSLALLLPWLLLAAAIATGAVLFLRGRAVAAELAAAEARNREHAEALDASRQQLDKALAKQQRSSEELAHARRKLEQGRKRAARAGDDARREPFLKSAVAFRIGHERHEGQQQDPVTSVERVAPALPGGVKQADDSLGQQAEDARDSPDGGQPAHPGTQH